MPKKNSPPSHPSTRELVTTRIFDAPRELVFEAWSRREVLEKWWGPQGFTTTTHHFDFRPGGTWKYTMHGPDGTDYPNRLVYDEIVPPERIVYSHHGGIDGVPAEFQQTATFTKLGEKTELTMRLVFPTTEQRDAVVEKYKADEGGKQTLARLGELLGVSSQPKHQLHIAREFDAPRSLVFEAWSKAEYLSRWFTPAPLTTPECVVDLRPGGQFRVVMRLPDGSMDFPMDGTFVEVVPEERIVFSARIHGDLDVHTTVRFIETDGKTTLAVQQVYSYEAEPTRGAKAGWTATLNQLGEHLRTRT